MSNRGRPYGKRTSPTSKENKRRAQEAYVWNVIGELGVPSSLPIFFLVELNFCAVSIYQRAIIINVCTKRKSHESAATAKETICENIAWNWNSRIETDNGLSPPSLRAMSSREPTYLVDPVWKFNQCEHRRTTSSLRRLRVRIWQTFKTIVGHTQWIYVRSLLYIHRSRVSRRYHSLISHA